MDHLAVGPMGSQAPALLASSVAQPTNYNLKDLDDESLAYINKLFSERIYGSSNGLLCLSYEKLNVNSPIWIYNPSLKKRVTLPRTSLLWQLLPGSSMSWRPLFGYGMTLAFGFHLGLNDYKVVRKVSIDVEELLSAVEIYSLSTKSWKMVDVIPPLIKSMKWVCGYGMYAGNEVFQEMQLLEGIAGGINSVEEYKESICLLQLNKDGQEEHINIWILQENYFKKLVTVGFPGMSLTPLGFRMKNELLLELHEQDSKGSDLAIYNLESKQLTQTGIRLVKNYYDAYSVATYVEV
ncbi:uncharacterized protein LOC117615359 [Prunus dulcis]|uniref:uncharacterized protein LOC117615359 n=1 Tax=Prunus dulcis TaxID=3755 RepID=UPI0014824622|nr:uncharacterized protein LOC117615359 [Prunus dulcis]